MSRLQNVMKQKRISISKLSNAVDRSPTYIKKIMDGEKVPAPKEQYLIAGVLGVNVIDIFTPEERVWHCPLCGGELGVISPVWGFCPECVVQVHRKSNAVYEIDENGNLKRRL